MFEDKNKTRAILRKLQLFRMLFFSLLFLSFSAQAQLDPPLLSLRALTLLKIFHSAPIVPSVAPLPSDLSEKIALLKNLYPQVLKPQFIKTFTGPGEPPFELRKRLRFHSDVLEAIFSLLSERPDIKQKIIQSLFIDAIIQNDVKTVSLLIHWGAHVNSESELYRANVRQSPLHFAAEAGNLEIAQILLDSGAHPNSLQRNKSHWGAIEWLSGDKTPLDIAIEKKNEPLQEILKAFGAVPSSTELHTVSFPKKAAYSAAALAGSIERIREYFQSKFDVDLNHTLLSGDTALHFAATAGQLETVEFLINEGLDLFPINHSRCIPLSAAMKVHQHEIAALLASRGGPESYEHLEALRWDNVAPLLYQNSYFYHPVTGAKVRSIAKGKIFTEQDQTYKIGFRTTLVSHPSYKNALYGITEMNREFNYQVILTLDLKGKIIRRDFVNTTPEFERIKQLLIPTEN